MHIARMRIKEEPPFTKEVTLPFDEQVNVFIGPNATGKSTLLSSLAYSPNAPRETWLTPSGDWPRSSDAEKIPNWEALPWVHLPSLRIGISEVLTSFKEEMKRARDIFGARKAGNERNRLYAIDVYKVLWDLYYIDESRAAAVDTLQYAYRCAKHISGDVVDGNQPEHYQGNPAGSDLMTAPEEEIQHALMGARTIDKTDLPLFIGMLSSGTQGIYFWLLYLALRIAHYYHSDDWGAYTNDCMKEPAIILIDEIENHLHPLWQRRVIPALVEAFPNAQIFAVTHSPFIVAGLKVGQVHRLYRDEDGAVQAQTNDSDIVGWTVEEILREFMEVNDPTDLQTSDAAAALRWLRYQHPGEGTAADWRHGKIKEMTSNSERTPDESAALRWLQKHSHSIGNAIDWWETEIEQLRMIVSRDLEAGGTIAAQREIFLEQLNELLTEDADDDED